MPEFPSELLDRVLASSLPRDEIEAALQTDGSVSLRLSQVARHLAPAHVVERSYDTLTARLHYRLRPMAAGETSGQVVEQKADARRARV
jgi:hypothetical protein